ncbi:hypothetical protein PIB30_017833 [Stylosanthes scabra]|uniref:Uncharacterized protein n=1 Tax=Stylosanthes scabra TaxID=79078 RepID=A0ABU6W8N6_9FABA|nr:hypothetical protein [Stylosanthes scabra]
MRVVGIEFLFPKSPSLLQSNDNSSVSHRFILAPFAFLGHFQSDSNPSRPETLEQTHQGFIQWCQLNAIIDQWKRDKMKGNRRGGITEKSLDIPEMEWWLCVIWKEELNRFIVGGYLSRPNKEVICYMDELVEASNEKEARVEGIELGVQFCLEEAHMKEEKLKVMVND